MKSVFNNVRLLFSIGILLIFQNCLGTVNSVFTLNRIVVASQTVDANGNQTIVASVGTYIGIVGSSPTNWTVTTISTNVSPTNNSNPIIFATPTGDIIIAWTYLNSSFVPQVAASVLRNGSSTWNSSSITHTIGSDTYGDLALTGNVAGNILLSWTAYDAASSANHIYGSTLSLTTSNAWSAPFVIF